MSSPSTQDLAKSLESTFSTCRSALDALSHDPVPDQTLADAPLDVLRNDFVSLLSLIYSHATQLSLAFKPPLTAPAAVKMLSEIAADVSRLVFCAQSVDVERHGRSIRKEVLWTAREIVENVESLVLSLFDMQQSRNPNDKTFILRTGTLHETIDKRRKDLSANNHAAVIRAWKSNDEVLRDALRENKDLVEEAEEQEAEEQDDGFDDGWGEVIGDTKKMSEEELERTKKVYNLIRLSSGLHNRILTRHITPIQVPPERLDDMLTYSSTLVSATDELVSSLYTPQDSDVIRARVLSIEGVVEKLRLQLQDGDIEATTAELARVDLSGNKGINGSNSEKVWLQTCFVHIGKAIDSLK